MSYFLKLIVTEIEARRKVRGKYIKILFNFLMRWVFLMGKIHRVWEHKLHFHVSNLFSI